MSPEVKTGPSDLVVVGGEFIITIRLKHSYHNEVIFILA